MYYPHKEEDIEKEIRENLSSHELEKKEIDECIKIALQLVNEDSYEYLGCGVNKIGIPVVVMCRAQIVYLLGPGYPTIMYAPRLLFGMREGHIHIDDVLVKHKNFGNGSIALGGLINYAKRNNVKLITGYLSPVDNDHKDRRAHFYKKFGFEVDDKKIVLRLS